MVSKGDLGVAYLVTVGVSLFAILVSGLLVSARIELLTRAEMLIGVFSILLISVTFVGTGAWLASSDLSEERVWKVAQTGAVGLLVPTLLTLLTAVVFPDGLSGAASGSLVTTNIAAGGIVGILVGLAVQFRAEHRRSAALNQRNMVFNRVLRHDIRTNTNVIDGYLGKLETDRNGNEDSVAVIRDRVADIVRLSDTARKLEELDEEGDPRPVDLSRIVEERVAAARETHPDASITTDDPGDVTVRGNDLLGTVVDNVLTNAIEHNTGDVRVTVTVEPPESFDDHCAKLRVEDNGPGFSEQELATHADSVETSIRHSDGTGLWIARWIVDTYDGSLSIENTDDGARVLVTLPANKSLPILGG